jgi:hypothetical protein
MRGCLRNTVSTHCGRRRVLHPRSNPTLSSSRTAIRLWLSFDAWRNAGTRASRQARVQTGQPSLRTCRWTHQCPTPSAAIGTSATRDTSVVLGGRHLCCRSSSSTTPMTTFASPSCRAWPATDTRLSGCRAGRPTLAECRGPRGSALAPGMPIGTRTLECRASRVLPPCRSCEASAHRCPAMHTGST